MDDLAEAWEGWLRPVAIIVAVVAVGALRLLGVVDDSTFGATVLAIALLGGAAVVTARALRELTTRLAKTASLTIVLGGLGLGSWIPYYLLTSGGTVTAVELSGPAEPAPVPPAGDGEAPYVVYLHAEPNAKTQSAEATIRLVPLGGRPRAHSKSVSSPRSTVRSPKPTGKTRHEITWPLTVDLSRGGTVQVEDKGSAPLHWPVSLQVRRAAPAAPGVLGFGALLFLGALWTERSRRGANVCTHVGAFVGGASIAGPLLAQFYTPWGVTKATLLTLLLSALIAAVFERVIVRKIIRPPALVNAPTRR